MKPSLATLVFCLAAALPSAAPAPAVAPSAPPRQATPATVEPTLPIRVDLGLEAIERGKGRGRGRLRVSIEAIDEIRDLEIVLDPDPALSIPEAASLRHPIERLRRGEKRDVLLSIEGPDARDLPLKLKATFRTPEGTRLELGAGIAFPPKPAPEGRLHAGALEYPAMMLPGPRP
jgi:hypothetical protein